MFKTGDEDSFNGLTEDEFDNLEEGDKLVHVHDVPDPAVAENPELDVDDERAPREVLDVGDYNPLEGGRVTVRVRGATIMRRDMNKWKLVTDDE